MSAGLWDWTLAVYARPGVEPLCLALQDEADQCVPYLLWAAWLAQGGLTASLGQGAEMTAEWEAEVTGPLRLVRRRLKGQGADPLRGQVKAAELQAEQVLLQRLEALAAPGGEPRPLAAALAAASASWRSPAPPEVLAALAQALA